MSTVAVIDYGMCNIDSVVRAVEECGGKPIVTDHEKEIHHASHIILPGVGSFSDAMHNLRQRSLDVILAECVLAKGTPFLGICLGMQLLATKGWEGGETQGLCLIEGEVRRLEPSGGDTRIPHVGWNEVHHVVSSPLFKDVPSRKDFYFVHSYHFCPRHAEDAIARTPYCGGFVSAVAHGRIFGTQFHPEKSQKFGFQILRNFLSFSHDAPC